MWSGCLFALALLATGCGRLEFDATTATEGDAGIDACAGGSCGGFNPTVGGCTLADNGPFTLVATSPTQGGGYGVWAASPSPYILRADTTGGLHSLRLDGTTFTQLDALPSLGWVEAVFSDGQYFYIGAPGTGLAVVRLETDGHLTQLAQNTTTLAEARRGWSSNGVLYIPNGGAGLSAFRFDGVALTQVGSPVASLSWGQGAWSKGSRVYFADADRFRVLDFDGSSFTDVITPDARHGGSSRVWSDGTTIFVASADGATAYRLNGTTLDELDTFTTAGSARDIWSDGQHVFVAAEGGGLYALAWNGTTFSQIDRIDTGGVALGVFGDGKYIYANDMSGGLHAYSGFTCRSW